MPRRILIQLDCDDQPSTFDSVVAVDAGADVLLRHGGVDPANVTGLVHGAIFTRGGGDLASTALFVGGSDVAAAEAVRDRVLGTFFGPMRVSVLLDPSGANSTAAAAVVAAARHVDLSSARAVVLGGTGPVGQRVGRLLARRGARVSLASRSVERAKRSCDAIEAVVAGAAVEPVAAGRTLDEAIAGAAVVIAAGAAGVTLLAADAVRAAGRARVLVDLNAVPPVGIEGVVATDKATPASWNGNVLLYGALGVGGTKMKIHRAAVARLFERNDLSLDAEELLAIGESLG
jgi:hypothetical protein